MRYTRIIANGLIQIGVSGNSTPLIIPGNSEGYVLRDGCNNPAYCIHLIGLNLLFPLKHQRGLMYSVTSNAPAWALYFNITEGCNNVCCFCASDSPGKKSYISTEIFCDSLRKYKLDINSQVVINGGEPTIHPGFNQILNCAIETGGRVILFTNGRSFANKNTNSNLVINKLHRISIPIYGAEQEVHDRLVGRKGAWKQTILGLKNLDALRKSNLGPTELELKLLAVRPSLSEWPKIVEYLTKIIKPPERIVLSGLILSNTLLANQQDLIPSMQELLIPINETIRRLRDLNIKLILLWAIPWCVLDDDNLEYFLETTLRNAPNETLPSMKDLYFDYRYPGGIELTAIDQGVSKKRALICDDCKLSPLCDGIPDFIQLSQGSTDVLHLSSNQ
jgi:sulfatase maturation enzyme AslB (radical SAM superfamily)